MVAHVRSRFTFVVDKTATNLLLVSAFQTWKTPEAILGLFRISQKLPTAGLVHIPRDVLASSRPVQPFYHFNDIRETLLDVKDTTDTALPLGKVFTCMNSEQNGRQMQSGKFQTRLNMRDNEDAEWVSEN
jgi:hypothetical protein